MKNSFGPRCMQPSPAPCNPRPASFTPSFAFWLYTACETPGRPVVICCGCCFLQTATEKKLCLWFCSCFSVDGWHTPGNYNPRYFLIGSQPRVYRVGKFLCMALFFTRDYSVFPKKTVFAGSNLKLEHRNIFVCWCFSVDGLHTLGDYFFWMDRSQCFWGV